MLVPRIESGGIVCRRVRRRSNASAWLVAIRVNQVEKRASSRKLSSFSIRLRKVCCTTSSASCTLRTIRKASP